MLVAYASHKYSIEYSLLFEIYGSRMYFQNVSQEARSFKRYNPNSEVAREYWADRWSRAINATFQEVIRRKNLQGEMVGKWNLKREEDKAGYWATTIHLNLSIFYISPTILTWDITFISLSTVFNTSLTNALSLNIRMKSLIYLALALTLAQCIHIPIGIFERRCMSAFTAF